MVCDTNKIFEWLKQPSTVKALVVAAGALGYYVDAGQLDKIIGGVLIFQGLINAFYENNPRTKTLDLKSLGEKLTHQEIVDLITFYKEKHHVANTSKR